MATDAIDYLCALLSECNVRVTLDPQRSISRPCVVCGTEERKRSLVRVATYCVGTRGGIRPGDPMVRPVCALCAAALLDLTLAGLDAPNLELCSARVFSAMFGQVRRASGKSL